MINAREKLDIIEKRLKRFLDGILSIRRIYLKISCIDYRTSLKGKQYAIIHFAEVNSNIEFDCHSVFDNYLLKEYENDFAKKIKIPYYETSFNLGYEWYYKLFWDDVYNRGFSPKNLNEIYRKDDIPVRYRNYQIYVPCFENVNISQIRQDYEVAEPFIKTYDNFDKNHIVPCDLPKIDKFLNYKNNYVPPSKSDDNDNLYYSYDTDYDYSERIDHSSMSEEDMIMEALANGEGERYGF